MGTRTFQEKQMQQQSWVFLSTSFNVNINMENRERARARNKEQRTPISLEEKHEHFIAAMRKWEMLAAAKVKMNGSEK